MKIEIIIALISVGGTALGAFTGAWFAYLSQKNQHIQLIKSIRVDRIFQAAETLLEVLLKMQTKGYIKLDGKSIDFALMFKNPDRFKEFYLDFQRAWYTKQYLLNTDSLNACEKVHLFIVDTIKKYPDIINPDKKPEFSTEEFSKLHADFLSLVETASKSLKEYLLHDLEKI